MTQADWAFLFLMTKRSRRKIELSRNYLFIFIEINLTMSNPVFDQLQQKANDSEAIGGTLKFVIDDINVYVDGTGNNNVVSESDEEADCTIITSAATLLELQSGDLNPMMAVMGGKVKIAGDMGLAMKVQSLMS